MEANRKLSDSFCSWRKQSFLMKGRRVNWLEEKELWLTEIVEGTDPPLQLLPSPLKTTKRCNKQLSTLQQNFSNEG
jgi:hypothetical protein